MTTPITPAPDGGPSWERYDPDKLMTVFVRTRVLRWLGVSVAMHLVLVLLTSFGYIRDRWIDPEGAVVRAARRAAALDAQPAAPATPPAAPETVAQGSPPSGTALMEARKDTPVMQRITETARPEDIPRQPDDLGLSIEDTRR